MATPEQMSSYYTGYPDQKDPSTWGVSPSGVRNNSFSAAQATWEASHGAPPTPSPVPGPSSPGSDMAAARAGDSTAHGGTIGPVTTGQAAKVLIGNMPAACMGDPHVCPMFSGPKAHGGGTITKGSATVLIGNKPAARVSDLTVCTSEPGQVAKGEMTVLIGDLTAAGSSSASSNSASSSAKSKAPVPKSSVAGGSPRKREPGESEQRIGTGTHWISIELVDEAEAPIVGEPYRIRMTDGRMIQGALDARGRAKITGLKDTGACDIAFVELDLAAWHRWGVQRTLSSVIQGPPPINSREGSENPISAGAASRAGRWTKATSGDCISSIAVEVGHFWQTIWDHSSNGELRQNRGNPNVLRDGDAVFVPNLRPKSEAAAVDQHHKFVRLGEPSKLLLRLLDENEPRANTPWTLDADGLQFTGTTDDDGNLAIPIRGSARVALLHVGHPGDEDTYELELGEVQPIETACGVAARLENLGYLTNGRASQDQTMTEALKSFQTRHGLQATGQIDPKTRERLLAEHGS